MDNILNTFKVGQQVQHSELTKKRFSSPPLRKEGLTQVNGSCILLGSLRENTRDGRGW